MTIDQKIEAMKASAATQDVCADAETIQAACCVAFKVTKKEFFGREMYQRAAYARFASMEICRESLKPIPLSRIARFHRRGHGTVMIGIRRAKDMLKLDPDFKRRYDLAVKLITETET